jgi:hypothetical protein
MWRLGPERLLVVDGDRVGARGWLSHLKWQLDGWNFWDGIGSLPVATAVQKIFDDLGIFEPSNATRTQLTSWLTAEPSWARQPNALIVGAMCPEFNVV